MTQSITHSSFPDSAKRAPAASDTLLFGITVPRAAVEKAPHPPSLTGDGLKRIATWERTHQSKVVRRLLAEVRRLQAIALRADQLERALRADGASLAFNSLHVVASSLRCELDELPLIAEREDETDRLLYGHMDKRKGVKDERR